MRKILLMVLVLACTFPNLQAQISHGGEPLTWNGKTDFPIAFERLPEFNEESMRSEDDINNVNKDVPYRFGKNFYIDFSLDNSGEWHTLPNGDRVWLLGIESEGAESINFIFDEFYLPHGATLFIYNHDHTDMLGSFTKENNNDEHTFSTYPLRGEKVIIEYYEPSRVSGMGELSVESITHAYRDIEAIARGLGDSGSCNNNVICPVSAGWEDQINSVAMIVVNGNGICTGALVNNTANDGHPYFLTADHCTGGGVTNWVFRFNWQSPDCANNISSSFDTVNGSTMLAQGGSADYALLEINNGNPIPTSYNPFYAGWDATGSNPTSQVGIHHPRGDIKKITFDNNPAGTGNFGAAICWRIFTWEDGTTEPGSSGSPLFDQNQRIIGQLFGGTASCGNNIDDYYGKFDVTYPNVCQWLAPGCNTQVINGYDPNTPTVALDAQMQGISSPSGTICGSTVTPEVTVRNAGSTTLTSFTVLYNVDGGANQSFPWSGSLASGSTISLTLPAISPGNGPHTFNASVSAPNGGSDQNTSNDAATSSFTINSGGTGVTFTFLTDCWGEETSWTLSQGGTVIASVPVNTYGDLTTNTNDFCLADGCYDLVINDSFGDGVEGSLYACGVDGDYSVVQDDGTVLVQMATAAFGSTVTETFCVTGTGDVPGCTDPTACNYLAAATVDDGSCSYPPSGDVCTDAQPISVNGGAISANNENTCDDGPNPSCGGTGILDTWFSFNYTGGEITITTGLGTLGDTRIAVYDACGGTEIACNDDAAGLGLASQINLSCTQLTEGQEYFIQAGGFSNNVGAFTIAVTSTPSSGCTTVGACNYDPAAICDDGSCEYTSCAGCTNPAACNYDATATIDDGSCDLVSCFGCTDPTACNYDATATNDDGSCEFTSCAGCTNPSACNYDPGATIDDGTCDLVSCFGCTDPTACNYDATATNDDGSCEYTSCAGCTTAGACNYDPAATIDDGSCEYTSCAGCTDPAACNYDATATIDDGTCDLLSCYGCTDPSACNYDATATNDDGSCEFTSCVCAGDFNGDGERNVADLLVMLAEIGCSSGCMSDMNGDDIVNTADMTAFLGLYGSSCP